MLDFLVGNVLNFSRTVEQILQFTSWTYRELYSLYNQFKPVFAADVFSSSSYKGEEIRVRDLLQYIRLRSCKRCLKLAHHTEENRLK